MKSMNKTEIVIGNTEIPISIYSSVEKETSFKQISTCCNASVNYKKVCSECDKQLEQGEIKKAIDVGDEFKEIDTDTLKTENGSLMILGVLDSEDAEDGVFKDGTIWFLGNQIDKKNKTKTNRNVLKFCYLRESLKKSKKSLICLISVRGKEHIVLLKPYFNAFVGLGVYHFDRIRDVKEISGYSESVDIDEKNLLTMAENIKAKEKVSINKIENTREKLIKNLLLNPQSKKEKVEENICELINF